MTIVARTGSRAGRVRLPFLLRLVVATLLAVLGTVLFGATAASAHVLPSSSVQLDVREDVIDATVTVPLEDLEAASGIDLGDTGADTAAVALAVAEHTDEITAYLLAHFKPTSDDGEAWAVAVGALAVAQAGDTSTTGLYQELTTIVTLTPPAGSDVRSFELGYDVIVDQEITHVVLVTVQSDWAGGALGGAYELGTIRLDTVTGAVGSLHVDLGEGSAFRGFVSMLVLGVQHIQEGTDHQLFLLTLLLPAPLIARGPRWGSTGTLRGTVRRIAGVTLAFTVGHTVTLAAGTLGLPVPAAAIEALIAVSILVAAVHAIRPIFAGREALVAGFFGLVHGLAFSETLRELDLSGSRLVLSLLGFNLGIEAMQLAVVALVLPPLVVLARAGRYTTLRVAAAVLTAVAAAGWLAARLGLANPIADAADGLGTYSIPVLAVLWVAAVAVAIARARPERTSIRTAAARSSVVVSRR